MNRRGFLRVVSMAPVAAVALPGAAAVAVDPSLFAPTPAGALAGYGYGYGAAGSVGDPMTPEFRLMEMRQRLAQLESDLGITADDFDGEQA